MHPDVMLWLSELKATAPGPFIGKRVLELGAYNINGTPRLLFENCEYVALDWRAGPGVDVVCLAHEYEPDEPFDTIISTEMLEHDPHWRETLAHLPEILNPGGAIILTVAAPGRSPHELDCAPDGSHYQPLTRDDVLGVLDMNNFGMVFVDSNDRHKDLYFYLGGYRGRREAD